MTDAYLRLPFTFDVCRLQRDLQRLQAHHWQQHINKQAHDGGWTALSLRAVDGNPDTIAVVEMDPGHYADTPYMRECSYIPEVLATLECQQASARLMSLRAGEEIRRHTDMDLGFEDGCVRLHIPIQTSTDVIFHIDDQPIHFGAGECWYMNANYPHQVSNSGDQDRIHLVIDCVVNDWLSTLFKETGYQKRVIHHKYGDPGISDTNVQQVIEQLEATATEAGLVIANRLRTIQQRDTTHARLKPTPEGAVAK